MPPHIAYLLTKIRGIGLSTAKKILDYMIEQSISDPLQIDPYDLCANCLRGRHLNLLEPFFKPDSLMAALQDADAHISTYTKRGITTLSITDELYPSTLRALKDHPILLYCRGNIELLRYYRNIAVVGTRKNTRLGATIAERTVQFFVSKGYTIVSGLALGIDTVAHTSTLAMNGKTISVLVDVEKIAPSSNKKLAEQILAKEGLLLAENEPGTSIHPASFVKRDRIQTGLSLAVFPIETAKDGGTMHAVKAALSNNRLIFVPDPTRIGYASKDIPQLEGIWHLSRQKGVIPYTKADYDRLLTELDCKHNEFVSIKNQTSSTQKQGTLF